MITRHDPDICIRPARPGDAAAQSELYRRSVAVLGSRDYSPVQVAAWLRLCPPPEEFAQLARDGRRTLVAEKDGTLQGFADVEPDGHINFFYCAPEAAGKGVAALLYTKLEATAKRQKIVRLYAEASEAAHRFFLRQGFTTLRQRDFEIGGVAIHNYAVEKILR